MQSFFVSSTFRDMQGERDALHRTVMPRVRTLAKEYGQSVQFVDLRWGISTSELEQSEAQAKILDVCLREIDACAPYMIVLLGERYGWMPGEDAIRRAADGAGFAPDTEEISVTELEIRYGIWKNRGLLSRCIFCFREPLPADRMSEEDRRVYAAGSEDDIRRMKALKEKIAGNPSAVIFRYRLDIGEQSGEISGYEAFADGLSEQLLEMLRREWGTPRQLTWQEREEQEDRLMAENLRENFVGMEAARRKYAEAIRKTNLVVIEGTGGSGKSAMMAQLAKDLSGEFRTELIFCGSNDGCMRTEQLLELLTWRLKNHPHQAESPARGEEETADIAAARAGWNRACREHRGSGEKVVFFLDAIDQLIPDDALLQSWFVPSDFPDSIRIAVSTTGKVGINRLILGARGDGGRITYRHFLQDKPSEAERRDIIRAHFAREHKQVSEAVTAAMLAHPLSENMLCLDMMVRWLSSLNAADFGKIAVLEQTMDGAAAIEQYLLGQIGEMPLRQVSFINAYIRRIMNFLAPNGDDYALARVILPLYFISMTTHGLSRQQLGEMQRGILDGTGFQTKEEHVINAFWNETDFSRMCAYMGPQLVEREDGRVDIAHRLIREALRQNELVINYSMVMEGYLSSCGPEDVTRQEDLIPLVITTLSGVPEMLKEEESRKGWMKWADSWIQDVVSDIGNLKNSENPEDAARGRHQWKQLVRSVVADLMTDPGRDKKVDLLCGVLAYAADRGESHFYWTFELIMHHVLQELNRRGMQAKVHACRIAMTLTRAKYEQGKRENFGNWSDFAKKRQLLWQVYAFSLMHQISGELRQNHYRLGAPPEIADGIDEVFVDYERRMEAWLPQDPRVLYRLARMETERALIASDQWKKGAAKEHAGRAEEYLRRMIRTQAEIPRETLAGYFGWGMSGIADVWCRLAHDAVFQVKKNYRRAEDLMREAFAFVKGADGERICDRETWFRMNRQMGVVLSGLDRHQEAADLLWQVYRDSEAPEPPLNQRERKELSDLGIRLGQILDYGFSPQELYDEAKGESKYRGRTRCYQIILQREENYMETAREDDTGFLWKMLHIREFRYMVTSASREEKNRILEELAGESRNLRERLVGTEDFSAMDLDLFDGFLKRLRQSNNSR